MMKRTDEAIPLQKRLMKPFQKKEHTKHTYRTMMVGAAIADLILDTDVPTEVIKRDLEDIRETLDFAISVISADGVVGQKLRAVH